MSSSISSFDLECIELIMIKRHAKILNTYLYELIWLMEKDANSCKLIANRDELNYLISVIRDFNNEIDRKIGGN